MKLPLVRMGNSRGVRIPKALIELCNLGEEVEVEVSDGHLILREAGGNRLGWAEAFQRRQSPPDPSSRVPSEAHTEAPVSRTYQPFPPYQP